MSDEKPSNSAIQEKMPCHLEQKLIWKFVSCVFEGVGEMERKGEKKICFGVLGTVWLWFVSCKVYDGHWAIRIVIKSLPLFMVLNGVMLAPFR